MVCLNKLYFIDENLTILNVIKTSQYNTTNLITQAKWFGPILLYANSTHINYATIKGSIGTILSYDNFENKNLFSMIMMDRILILSKGNSQSQRKKQDFKVKAFNIIEPLIVSYIDMSIALNYKVDG